MKKLITFLIVFSYIQTAESYALRRNDPCRNIKGCPSNSDHNDHSATNQQTQKKTTESDKKPDCSKCECKESPDCCKDCDKCKNTGCSTGDQSSGDNSTNPTKGLTEEEAIVQEQIS